MSPARTLFVGAACAVLPCLDVAAQHRPDPGTAQALVRYEARETARRALSRDDPKVAHAILAGLSWLQQHQSRDGRWDADDFWKGTVKPKDLGPGAAHHDVGLTGLATLAFLRDGLAGQQPHREVVDNALAWLCRQQDKSGVFGPRAAHDFMYDHAIATLALVEAGGMAGRWQLANGGKLREHAQRGLDYLEKHRNPYAVWRYQPRDNDNDTSVTTWCTLACAAGRDFGLRIGTNSLPLAKVWLDQVSDPVTGHVGYAKRGQPSARNSGPHTERFPADANEAMTAAGLMLRERLGEDPETSPLMQRGRQLVATKPPRWQPDQGTVDFYAWYFASRAMAAGGGEDFDAWRDSLRTEVVGHQRQDGAMLGSWDPVGVWGEAGGRVCSTALAVLALQACYGS